MAEARSKHDWNQTSLLASLLYNPSRKPGSAAKDPSAFNPHTKRAGVDFGALRATFGRGAKGARK